MAAERFIAATGTTTASAAIPDGAGPNTLVVIDFIAAGGTGGATYNVTIAGTNICRRPAAANGNDVFIDFEYGYPVWSASGADTVPATSVTVDFGTSTAAAFITVGFHYERPGTRRTAGQ